MSLTDAENLEQFCRNSLALLGADVSQASPGVLLVDLPPGRLDLFDGRSSLRLVFGPGDEAKDTELVAPGSYVLDRILDAIRERGRIALVRAEPTATGSASPPDITLSNAELRLLSSETTYKPLLLVNFRVSLVSDENLDRLCRAVIDLSTGEPVDVDLPNLAAMSSGDPPGAVEDIDLTSGLDAARSIAERFARQWADSVRDDIEKRLASEVSRLDTYYADMLADSVKSGHRGDVRKVRRQRERALAEYNNFCRRFELVDEALASSSTFGELKAFWKSRRGAVRRELLRLRLVISSPVHEYYARIERVEDDLKILDEAMKIADQLIARFPSESRAAELDRIRTSALEKARQKIDKAEAVEYSSEEVRRISEELDAEKARRVADLRDRSRLKVLITPLSASLIRYPRVEWKYAAVRGATSALFTAYREMAANQVELPICGSCGERMSSITLCSCGSLVCPACHRTCTSCGKDLCPSCVGGECGVCRGAVCQDDFRSCGVCGLLACKADMVDCPDCGRSACPDHRQACRFCGQQVCDACGSSSGYCQICMNLFPAEASVQAVEQILADLSDERLPANGRWYVGEGSNRFVLARVSSCMAVFVLDKSPCRVSSRRTLSPWTSLVELRRLRR